jgi:hypothetical protein
MKHLFFLSAIFIVSGVSAFEANLETLFRGQRAAKSDLDTAAEGTVLVRAERKDFVGDLQYQFGDGKNLVNVAKVKLVLPKADIVLGRQLMSWGSGYNFNPTDIFNAKPLGAAFDPTFVKRGRDAVTLTLAPVDGISFEGIFAAKYSQTHVNEEFAYVEEGQEDHGGKLKVNIANWDIALSYARLGERDFGGALEGEDDVTGLSLKGTLPLADIGFWLEAASYSRRSKVEVTSGSEYFWEEWTFLTEYYRNGFGEGSYQSYNPANLMSGRMLGRDYLAPSLSYAASEKLTLTLFSFFNLNDGGSLFGGVVDYYYNDIVELVFLPVAISAPKESEYGDYRTQYGDYIMQGMVKVNL